MNWRIMLIVWALMMVGFAYLAAFKHDPWAIFTLIGCVIAWMVGRHWE